MYMYLFALISHFDFVLLLPCLFIFVFQVPIFVFLLLAFSKPPHLQKIQLLVIQSCLCSGSCYISKIHIGKVNTMVTNTCVVYKHCGNSIVYKHLLINTFIVYENYMHILQHRMSYKRCI